MSVEHLSTKLTLPPARSGVPRPRLREALSRGLAGKLLLVSAPAGFGKSTLVADWIRATGVPAAWLTIDDADNDVSRFLSYFSSALEPLLPRAASAMRHLAAEPPVSDVDAVMTVLATEATARPDLVLVLDDYHHISDPSIHAAVGYLVERMPARLHLLIATRADPPLPLARLRADGDLTEIRAADLRFTREESTAFFAGEADGRLSDDQIAALSQRTEGWIAGMRLAATSLRGRQDVVTFVRDFSGSNRYILDYLSEEVMRGLAPADRSFLVRTSVLDRFCAPVCDLLTDDADSQTILERMESANIFIEPLDDTREWYRYHPLFADMLRSRLARLPADEVAELHRRASGWFEARGMRGEATAHALKAGDFGRAADLALAGAEDALMHCDSAALLRWTDALPAIERAKRPLLCVYRACAMLQQGKPRTDVEACLAEIESSSAETGLGPELAGLRSRLAYLSGDPETSLALARRAMDALEPGRTFLRHTLSGIMDILSQEVGDPQAVSARHGAGPAITGGRGPASGPGFDHAHGPPPHPVEVLSGREIAIVRLLAEGLTNKEIAERAFVSEETVKWHASNIYGKLGVRNRTEAVARARALGILAGT